VFFLKQKRELHVLISGENNLVGKSTLETHFVAYLMTYFPGGLWEVSHYRNKWYIINIV